MTNTFTRAIGKLCEFANIDICRYNQISANRVENRMKQSKNLVYLIQKYTLADRFLLALDFRELNEVNGVDKQVQLNARARIIDIHSIYTDTSILPTELRKKHRWWWQQSDFF